MQDYITLTLQWCHLTTMNIATDTTSVQTHVTSGMRYQIGDKNFWHTRLGFLLFLPILPRTNQWKDKYRTAAHWKTSDLIVMSKWLHHSMSYLSVLGTSGSLYFRYENVLLMMSKQKNPLIMWGWIEKSVPSDKCSASLLMPNGDTPDIFFYPTLTFMIDSCILFIDKISDILIWYARIKGHITKFSIYLAVVEINIVILF